MGLGAASGFGCRRRRWTPPPGTEYPGLELIFSESFDTRVSRRPVPRRLREEVDRLPEGVEGHVEEGELNPDIISVRNGVMNMRLHTENGAPQVAAPEPKINGNNELNQLYGRYEMRFRADPVSGYKLAWLLWPKSEIWPRDGEIDAPEGNLTGTISAFMHRQGATAGSDQAKFSTTAGFNDWHVLAYEWTPTRFEVFLDTKSIGCATARILNTPMRWVLQSETELNKTYPAQNAVANVQCDYVKAWRYTGKAA